MQAILLPCALIFRVQKLAKQNDDIQLVELNKTVVFRQLFCSFVIRQDCYHSLSDKVMIKIKCDCCCLQCESEMMTNETSSEIMLYSLH